MNKKLTRWPYLAAGCLVILFLGFIYTWSIFTTYLAADFGWSAAQLSLNFTFHNIFSCFGAFVAGRMLRRMSSRSVVRISALLIFVGLFASGFLKSYGSAALVLLYICYGGVASFGLGMSYSTSVGIPPKWFPDHSGLISGLLLTFIGIGTFLLSAVAQRLCEAFGIYTALKVFGTAIAAVILLCSHWLIGPGEDVALPQSPKKAAVSARDLTSGEAARKPSFWIFFLWNICLSASGLIIINRAANIAIYFGAAALVGMLVSIFNSVGRLIFGQLSDSLTATRIMLYNDAVLAVGGGLLLVGALTDASLPVFIGILCVGAAFGANLTLRVTALGENYGWKYNSENFGLVNLCVIPASLLGPMISGYIIDAQGGAYTGTFVLVLCLAAAAFVLDFAFRKTRSR